MTRWRVLGWWTSIVVAAAAGSLVAPAQQPESLEELSKALQPLLADALPTVLYEKRDNWGRTSRVASGLQWQGLRPKITYADRNDGAWKHIKVSVRNPKQSVLIKMHDLKKIDADTQTFQTDLAFNCNVEYDQQNWESGVRLWSGSVRARLRVTAQLECENVFRVEAKEGAPLPDVVFRLRVTKAKVGYYDLVVEHIAGVGGTAAKVLGDTFHDALKQWKPSIERKLLDRGSAAIVKAADTKEVRLGLSGLFKEKKPTAPAPK